MYSLATPEGKVAVNTATPSSKIVITKFQMGDFVSNLPNLTTDPAFDVATINTQAFITDNFTLKHEGLENDIKYNPVALNRVVLKCYAPPDIVDTFHYDSVLLFAEFDGVEIVFSLHYYNQVNPKFNIEQTKGGMRYYFLLTLEILNIGTRFDFSNLSQEEVTFLDAEDWYTLPAAHKELKDQGILHNHFNTPNSNPHVIFNSREQWFGTPLSPVVQDGIYRDTTIPMVGNFFPIENETIPTGYQAWLQEDGTFFLDRDGKELMIKNPDIGYDALEHEGDPILHEGDELLVARAPTLTYQIDGNNYPLRDGDGNLIPV